MQHEHGRGTDVETADFRGRRGLRLVTAESCTAGLIAARIAAVPDAGKVLESAFVAYDPTTRQSGSAVSTCRPS